MYYYLDCSKENADDSDFSSHNSTTRSNISLISVSYGIKIKKIKGVKGVVLKGVGS